MKVDNIWVGSGIIGKKWAGFKYWNTILFLNASDASGDMGMITSNDIVILISLSGDSEELKILLDTAQEIKIFV